VKSTLRWRTGSTRCANCWAICCLAKVGPEVEARLKARVANEIRTTFASHYTRTSRARCGGCQVSVDQTGHGGATRRRRRCYRGLGKTRWPVLCN
jgi:hypothetical protein